MFNLNNFDLDFDDNFECNIFSKSVCNADENIKSKEESVCSQSKRNHNIESSVFEKTKEKQLNSNETQNKLKNSNNSCSDILNSVFFNDCKSDSPNLKRSSTQDEKPHKKRASHEGLPQRKFPGPAGLLPDKPFKEIKDFSFLKNKECNEEDKEEDKNEPLIYSQSSGSVFMEPTYQKLLSDFDLNESKNPLSRYTVQWVKKTAVNKALHGRKIPFLGVVLHSINHSTPDPVLLLRDPTGEINGTLHREVWADLGGKLRAGIALALRQVGVLITGVIRRQIYLNITINNILAVYSPSDEDDHVHVKTVNKVSKDELLKSFEKWQAQCVKNSQVHQNQSPASLFSTVESRNPAKNTNKEEIQNLKNKLQNFVESSKPKESKSEKLGRTDKRPEGVFENLGIVLTDADFLDAIDFPQENRDDSRAGYQREPEGSVRSSTTALSQAESLIFEEVLSGIDLDEFEM